MDGLLIMPFSLLTLRTTFIYAWHYRLYFSGISKSFYICGAVDFTVLSLFAIYQLRLNLVERRARNVLKGDKGGKNVPQSKIETNEKKNGKKEAKKEEKKEEKKERKDNKDKKGGKK